MNVFIDEEEGLVVCDGIICDAWQSDSFRCDLCPMRGIIFDPEDEVSEELYNYIY